MCSSGTASWYRGRARAPAPASRPRPGQAPGVAAGALSRALAGLRRASGLTQPALSALTGYSVTTIGHAETGRLWQSRDFWEKTDLALTTGGELTRLHDDFRAGAGASAPPGTPPALTRVTVHWSDGTATTVYPPVLP
jgi:Helix-turn-helix domain